MCFENDVQYINRIQRSDWLKLFEKADLLLVEEEVEPKNVSRVKVANIYQKYEEYDLRCGGLKIVYHKPL